MTQRRSRWPGTGHPSGLTRPGKVHVCWGVGAWGVFATISEVSPPPAKEHLELEYPFQVQPRGRDLFPYLLISANPHHSPATWGWPHFQIGKLRPRAGMGLAFGKAKIPSQGPLPPEPSMAQCNILLSPSTLQNMVNKEPSCRLASHLNPVGLSFPSKKPEERAPGSS